MKKSVYGIALFALMLLMLSLSAVPVLAADDSDVKGLWLEIPDLPEADSTSFNAQSGGEGEAYFERVLDGGALTVSVERIDAEDRNGDAWGPGDAAKLTVRLESIRKEIEVAEDEVDITESEEELAEIYSYPVATTRYMTGGEEDMRGNQDIFIFTDDWIFRVHLSIAADHVEDYDSDDMKGWFENMKIVERDSSETDNGDESNAGQVIELSADDADLSEAPDVIVEGDPHNLGGWHGENTVIFHTNLEEAGAYRVILVYSKEESVGDPAKLRITAQNKDSDSSGSGYFNIPATGNDWSNYVERELGTFNHLEAGETVLRMESEEPQRGRYVMNLRSIKLLPADE